MVVRSGVSDVSGVRWNRAVCEDQLSRSHPLLQRTGTKRMAERILRSRNLCTN